MIEPVEYRPSRVRMAVVSGFLLLLLVGFAWALTEPKAKPEDRPLFLVGLLGSGAAFVATLFPLLRPRALLRLGEYGILERGHFGGENLYLPWTQVSRVETARWRLVPVLILVPVDRERALADANAAMVKAARGNERTFGHPFVIDARMYGQKAATIAAEIERRLGARPRRRR